MHYLEMVIYSVHVCIQPKLTWNDICWRVRISNDILNTASACSFPHNMYMYTKSFHKFVLDKYIFSKYGLKRSILLVHNFMR